MPTSVTGQPLQILWTAHVIKRLQGHIVHLDPNRTPPIVLIFTEQRMRLGQTPEPIGGPEMFRVSEDVENGADVRGGGREEAEEEGKEGDIAFVADMI